MAKTFSLRGTLVPSQGRKTSSQGGGMPGGGAVAIGTPQESASTVINNINNVTNVVGGDYSKIIRITISDLLALDTSEVSEHDLFIVYASGSDEGGWSGDPFEYDGETYPAESFFQLINGEWQPITDEIDLSKSPKFGNLPEEVYLIKGLFPQTSYPNVYGRYKAGMQIAEVKKYHLDDAGVYRPVKESTGTPGGGTSVNDMWTIIVPYARSYMDGGTMHYRGGALDDADYEIFKNLASGGGGTTYVFQGGTNSFTVTPSDTGVAQTVRITPSVTTDATPTADSANPVQSGGVKAALEEKSNTGHKHSASDITSGVLAVERGGTGQATLEQACNSLITSLRTDTSQNNVPTDGDYFVSQFRGGTYDTYFRRPMSALWAYIKAKADSVYAAISHTHTTSDITGLATVATSGSYADLSNTPIIRFDFRLANGTDLNTVTWDGMYYADNNSIVNAPAGVTRFGLIVLRNSSAASRVQILYASNGDRYERMADVYGTWGAWTKIVDDNIKYSSQSLTPAQQAQARTNIGASAIPDYVVFEQTGSVYNYTFTQISSSGDATIRYDLMSNASSTHDMPICVDINGLETAEDYKDYLRSHVITVIVTGNEQSGLTQIDVFRSAFVYSSPSRKGINILLKTEIFEPNTRNRFVVKLNNISL